jgi:hypothetical protein
LPPRLDTTTGHGSFPRALADAGQRTAAEQAVKRVQAAIARQELADVLMKHPKAANREVIAAWINTLDDDQLLGYLKRLAAASGRRELAAVDAAARGMLDAAYRVVEQIPTWPARGE